MTVRAKTLFIMLFIFYFLLLIWVFLFIYGCKDTIFKDTIIPHILGNSPCISLVYMDDSYLPKNLQVHQNHGSFDTLSHKLLLQFLHN